MVKKMYFGDTTRLDTSQNECASGIQPDQTLLKIRALREYYPTRNGEEDALRGYNPTRHFSKYVRFKNTTRPDTVKKMHFGYTARPDTS